MDSTKLLELDEIIRALQKAKHYLPVAKTPSVIKLEALITSIINYVKRNDVSHGKKAGYIKEHLYKVGEFIKQLESNDEVILTSIQVEELHDISRYLNELASTLELMRSDENNMEQALRNAIINSSNNVDQINELAQFYLQTARYEEAENLLQNVSSPNFTTYKLLGESYAKQQNFIAAKAIWNKALELAPEEEIATLRANLQLAEQNEMQNILMQDKDIAELKRLQLILEQSGDMHLTHLASKGLADLYVHLVNPNIQPLDKVTEINNFVERWNKYLHHQATAIIKIHHDAKTEEIIQTGLAQTLRILRETFAAQQTIAPNELVASKSIAEKQRAIKEEQEALTHKKEMTFETQQQEKRLTEKKVRDETLLAQRKEIYKSIQEERYTEALTLLNSISTPEMILADYVAKAKSHMQLGLLQDSQAKNHLESAVENFDIALDKQKYTNLKILDMKIQSEFTLGRLYYMDGDFAKAEQTFKSILKEMKTASNDFLTKAQVFIYYLMSRSHIHYPEPIKPSQNEIENLFHYPALEKEIRDYEQTFIKYLVQEDRQLNSSTPHVKILQRIVLQSQRPLSKKTMAIMTIHDIETANKNTPLTSNEVEMLTDYREALINIVFIELVKQSTLASLSAVPLIKEIKDIRIELREGSDLKLATIGLTPEQRLMYLNYELQLAKEEDKTSIPKIQTIINKLTSPETRKKKKRLFSWLRRKAS